MLGELKNIFQSYPKYHLKKHIVSKLSLDQLDKLYNRRQTELDNFFNKIYRVVCNLNQTKKDQEKCLNTSHFP